MNLFKLLGNLNNIKGIQQDMQDATEELAKMEFEGKAGGDMVTVKVSGAQKVISVSIDFRLIDDREKELIEELVASATNAALTLAKQETAKVMQERISSKLDMPELGDMMQQFLQR